jgi:hypothetical protein
MRNDKIRQLNLNILITVVLNYNIQQAKTLSEILQHVNNLLAGALSPISKPSIINYTDHWYL